MWHALVACWEGEVEVLGADDSHALLGWWYLIWAAVWVPGLVLDGPLSWKRMQEARWLCAEPWAAGQLVAFPWLDTGCNPTPKAGRPPLWALVRIGSGPRLGRDCWITSRKLTDVFSHPLRSDICLLAKLRARPPCEGFAHSTFWVPVQQGITSLPNLVVPGAPPIDAACAGWEILNQFSFILED